MTQKLVTVKNEILPCLLLLITITFFSSDLYAYVGHPRPEYPRPQFERKDWMNLNGTWTYQFDFGKSGKESGCLDSKGFEDNIIVPFCPESSLSGVNYKDFIPAMWYHREINIPQDWKGKRVLIHFGGVDYKSEIYIDGKLTFTHFGGSSSFSVDITDYVAVNKTHHLVVYVEDDVRSRIQTGGKQSRDFKPRGTSYTRVTGIWQTVWLEAVNKGGLKSCKIIPDLDNKHFIFQPQFFNLNPSYKFTVRILDDGKEIVKKTQVASNASFTITKLKNVKTWSPESPFLYDIEFIVTDEHDNVIDRVSSYAGMRKVELINKTFYLNNEPYYQRLVLDQGYYPDGQWTAPSDEQLKRDVELGKKAGFNGARLHQKVFEPRYLYWADKLGYLTWGESANWGLDYTNPMAARNMIPEWEERVERDFNVTSLVVWSPLNETWMLDVDGRRARLTNELYFITKRLDPTRPVSTTSGGLHCGFTDLFSEHTYVQSMTDLYELLKDGEKGKPYVQQRRDYSGPYKGEPYIIGEFGGIHWIPQEDTVDKDVELWVYGNAPKSLEEFYARLESQVSVLLSLDHITGFCYTQIVDIEGERNGIYTYDRKEKFDMNRIQKILTMSKEEAKKLVEEKVLNK